MTVRMISRVLVLCAGLTFLSTGCDDNHDDVDGSPDADRSIDSDIDNDGGLESDGDVVDEPDGDTTDSGPEIDPNPDCDPLVPTLCALPWPSNLFLVADSTRSTGYSLTFGETTLPANIRHVHPDPSIFGFDGYTVGTAILVHFPGLDTDPLPGELSIASSIEVDSPVVLLEVTESGTRRVPVWAELDANAQLPEETILFVRPAEILRHETRYVVAFRDLIDLSGAPIQPSPAFRLLREGRADGSSVLAPRIERFESIFNILDNAGVDRESLVLAWDFMTASSESAHGDMLSIRDQAYELVGQDGPELTIDSVVEQTGNELIAYRVLGTFTVPDFTEERIIDGSSGYALHRDESGRPAVNGWVDREFGAIIPRDNGDGRPLELMEYGHGLLGTFHQVFGGQNEQVAFDHGQVYFGATLTGFGDEDTNIIVSAITETSRMIWFTERIHQGVMEYLLLARAMSQRFSSLPEITALGVTIDRDQLWYSGISQGGIYGATVMALSVDMTRGHLGVPGQNYNLLLERSVDFTPYLALLTTFYPERFGQPVILESLATLWQTTDPVSYCRHITAEPFPGTPVHHVLLAQAQYDWQVAPLTNEIAARSDLGLALMEGYGRAVDLVEPTPYPHGGSALVNYSFGDPWAPTGNSPPPTTENGDPHQKPRRYAHHNFQMIHFLRTGEVIDACGGDGCTPE